MLTGRGMVALHDAAGSSMAGRPGQTSLTFEADEIDELKDRLELAGIDATIWDEAYGRVLSIAGPGEVELWIDERSKDLYGYRLHESRPDDRWSVTPYLTGVDRTTWQRLLELLGADATLRFGAPDAEYAVRLDLSTTEDLDDVRRRLTGHQVTRTEEGLEIVDPDGQLLVVHG
jgi:hypothetical protein